MTITTNYGDAELSPAEMARDNLLRLVADIRAALGTPDDMDVVTWAAQVAADAAQWRAVPVAEISRWAYDYQTVDDERKIIAWIQDLDDAQEVTTE